MRIQGKDIWPMVKQTFADFFEDKAQTLAAALAIYTMLSIAPLLVIVTKIVGVVYRDDNKDQVANTLKGVVPGMEPDQIKQMIETAGQHGSGVLATTIATIVAIFGATGVFGQLQDAMNTIWEVKPKPNQGIWGFIRTRFLSFAMVLGIAFLFMVSTVGTTLVTTLGEWVVGADNKIIAGILSHVVSLVVMTVLFLLIFKVLPDAKTEWKDCLIGAVITAVLFEIGKFALAMYLEGSATKVFGAAGSLAALLLFVFYAAQIMFLGAEFTQVYARKYGAGVRPAENAVKITEEDRAQEGRPSKERVAAKAGTPSGAGGGRAVTGRPYGAPAFAGRRTTVTAGMPGSADSNGGGHARQYVYGAAGVVLGAVAGGLGMKYLSEEGKKPTRKQAAAVRLDERIHAVEQKLGRVSRLRDYLDELDVSDRIDKVEREIRRAGRHVRAKETGRPLWLVRLGDLIGGRWSNL